MKRNEIKALASQSTAELNKQLGELLKKLAQARLELKAGKLANTKSTSLMSDDVARIKTHLRQRELAVQSAIHFETTPVVEESAQAEEAPATKKTKKAKKD